MINHIHIKEGSKIALKKIILLIVAHYYDNCQAKKLIQQINLHLLLIKRSKSVILPLLHLN